MPVSCGRVIIGAVHQISPSERFSADTFRGFSVCLKPAASRRLTLQLSSLLPRLLPHLKSNCRSANFLRIDRLSFLFIIDPFQGFFFFYFPLLFLISQVAVIV